MISQRHYRRFFASELEQHLLVIGETDLAISLPRDIWDEKLSKGLRDRVIEQRHQLQSFIIEYPDFAASHQPVKLPVFAPRAAQKMAEATARAGVGPMAAVAGFFAELAGRYIRENSLAREIIVENGGDIFIDSQKERFIGIYGGEKNIFTAKIAVKLLPEQFPCGVCTSSGTIGQSFSYGKADVAMIVAGDTALADAVATATANRVKTKSDVAAACEFAMSISGIIATLVICKDQMAASGKLELVSI
jgi:ApbE superfamily uncharacterized protein (UPF0280 family)